MALRKTIELPDGSTAEYLKANPSIRLTIDLYRNQDSRIAGKLPAVAPYLQVPLEALSPEIIDQIKTQIYVWAKNNTVDDMGRIIDLTDAEDC